MFGYTKKVNKEDKGGGGAEKGVNKSLRRKRFIIVLLCYM